MFILLQSYKKNLYRGRRASLNYLLSVTLVFMYSMTVPYLDYRRITRRNNYFLCEIRSSRMLLNHNCYEIRTVLCHIATVDLKNGMVAAYISCSSPKTSSTVEIGC